MDENACIRRTRKTINIFNTPEMAPAYKLTYFPIQGIAEPSRFLIAYAGIEYEDCRLERENWPQIKPTMPFGQVPILEHNNKIVNQHTSIARYFAKKAKLVGDNDWEALEIDAVVDTINDLRLKIALYCYEPDEAIKASRKEPLFKETIPYYLERFEGLVKKNNGHLAIGRLSWADLYFVGLLTYLNFMISGDLIANYPSLGALKDKVLALPAIKAWVEKRPKTNW